VPAHFVTLPRLPLNANGKVDRTALPPPERGRAVRDDAPPRDAAERAIAAAWCEVLGLERVGIHDNFFELGGHSLSATQLAARVRAGLGLDVDVSAIFGAPTVEATSSSEPSGAVYVVAALVSVIP